VDTFDPGLAPRKALWESIVAVVRRAIILGELQPGLHLEEPALAEKFGVSRIPVREALTRLAHEGLVRLEPRRGAFVVGVTETDIHDIYDLRLLIEAHAIRKAAERSDSARLARLQAHADEMSDAVRFNQVDRVAEPDVNFHRQIVVMAGSQRLLAAWDPIGGLIATFLTITNTTHRDMPRSVASHQRMIDLLQAHDAAGAERELRSHLENGEAIMRRALQGGYVGVAASVDRNSR
jgi:GntR family transcriptional regulator of gluconate operon